MPLSSYLIGYKTLFNYFIILYRYIIKYLKAVGVGAKYLLPGKMMPAA